MPLSLESIHQPLNDFFLDHFKTGAGSPLLFRFDKFGSVISDRDFIDPNHPELGYSSSLAMEKFSDLVNRVPIEDPDRLNLYVSQMQVDETYFGILISSIAFIPEGVDDDTRSSIVESFGDLKTEAQTAWENLKMESGSGLMVQFRPTLAGPKDWYDKSNANNWTHQSFDIAESGSGSVPAKTLVASAAPLANSASAIRSANSQLWRKKIDDVALQQLSPTKDAAANVPIANGASPVIAARATGVPSVPSAGAATAPTFELHDNFVAQMPKMEFSQRLAVSQYLVNNAPTEAAVTNSLAISFDFCLVSISRPWYREAFIRNQSWYIPNTAKGSLTTAVDGRLNMTVLPVGVVAIRNLNIKANWSESDKENAKDATAFGPFKVNSGILNNTLSHEGIQIIGWLLQRMPELPPNSPPPPKQIEEDDTDEDDAITASLRP